MSEHRAKGPGKQSNTRFEKMIAAYATAAGAVGVALLTPAKPAEAEIVYTKTRVTINDIAGPYLLDLNHDGIPDLSIGFCSCRLYGTAFTVESAPLARSKHGDGAGWQSPIQQQPCRMVLPLVRSRRSDTHQQFLARRWRMTDLTATRIRAEYGWASSTIIWD